MGVLYIFYNEYKKSNTIESPKLTQMIPTVYFCIVGLKLLIDPILSSSGSKPLQLCPSLDL